MHDNNKYTRDSEGSGIAGENAATTNNRKIDPVSSLRTEEVRDIISRTPNWMIRWGTFLVFFLILLIVFFSWLIQYPEVLTGEVTITTKLQPLELKSPSSGKISKLYFKDKSLVEKGDVLAEIENLTDNKSMDELKGYLSTVIHYINSDTNSLPFYEMPSSFGQLQKGVSELEKNLNELKEIRENTYYSDQISTVKNKIENYQELIEISESQKNLLEKELVKARNLYLLHREFFKKEHISKTELDNKETAFLKQKMELEELKKSIVQQKITLINARQTLIDHRYDKQESERQIITSITSLIKELEQAIISWQQSYTVISPFDGKIVYSQKWVENKHVDRKEVMYTLLPENQDYFAFARVQREDFGKVRKGQRARMSLYKFPAYEYGFIEGVIESVAEVPYNEEYLLEISLTKGKVSTYHKKLNFTPKMKGKVEIITEEMRLINRIFHQFNKIFTSTEN